MLLDKINSGEDLRKLNIEQLDQLASEIRSFLVQRISETGGHLASNLGVVELTIALHRVFDISVDDDHNSDHIVWDVGHQCYTHKILSGRRDRFAELRQFGGLSGFPKIEESPADSFNTGHSSTSISAAAGIAKAKELNGLMGKTIAVIGDGAMTGGMAFEALNHAGQQVKNLIVILNDNDMSITKNVGGISRALKRLRSANKYIKLKDDVKSALDYIPVVGTPTKKGLSRFKNDIKKLVLDNESFFEGLGFKYLGPVDGHSLCDLIEVLNAAAASDKPAFIHVHTKKGKGYLPAENNPSLFHGVGRFDPVTGEVYKVGTNKSWSECFGTVLLELAAENADIVAVTAAMPHGTGLLKFANQFPARFFDVGIAEQHATTFAAGLSKEGLIPVFAVYSTFLQRSYDQILHDVALQNLHVIFAIDRSGPVGRDGETHQGVYDISYLSHIPNMTILSPATDDDLRDMLRFAVNELNGPVAIRYPRGAALTRDDFTGLGVKPIGDSCLKARVLRLDETEPEAVIISAGVMLKNAAEAVRKLSASGISVSLIDVGAIKPLDTETIRRECSGIKTVICIENNVDIGGLGQQIESALGRSIIRVNYGDKPVPSGSVAELERMYGLDADSLANKIKTAISADRGIE